MACGTGGGCDGCSVSEKRGCGTSSVFNWLAKIGDDKSSAFSDLAEVQFKMNRKGYFQNTENISISEGDWVVVESDSGYDIGKITLLGEIVNHQLKRKKIDTSKAPLKKIHRLAEDTDIQKLKTS